MGLMVIFIKYFDSKNSGIGLRFLYISVLEVIALLIVSMLIRLNNKRALLFLYLCVIYAFLNGIYQFAIGDDLTYIDKINFIRYSEEAYFRKLILYYLQIFTLIVAVVILTKSEKGRIKEINPTDIAIHPKSTIIRYNVIFGIISIFAGLFAWYIAMAAAGGGFGGYQLMGIFFTAISILIVTVLSIPGTWIAYSVKQNRLAYWIAMSPIFPIVLLLILLLLFFRVGR